MSLDSSSAPEPDRWPEGVRANTAQAVGDVLKALRKERGMTQQEFAELIETSRKWVGEAEHGKPTAELGLALKALNRLGYGLRLYKLPEPSISREEFFRRFTHSGPLPQ